MRFIPTNIHGIVDYIVGALLIAAPWLFAFAAGGAETWVPVIIGAAIIAYSLFTDYEWGVFRKMDMRTHLGMDIAGGVVLAVSPWLFGFAALVWIPHLIVGLLEIGAGLFTRTEPSGVRMRGRRVGEERAAT